MNSTYEDDWRDGPRLPEQARAELESYWQERESAMGFRSSFGPMVDRICGLRANAQATPESYASSRVAGEARRVRHALQTMQESGLSSRVTVLYRIYGPRDPNVAHAVWGHLAPIAEYTPTVERIRCELAQTLADKTVAERHGKESTRTKSASQVVERIQVALSRTKDRRKRASLRRRLAEVTRPPSTATAQARIDESTRSQCLRQVTTADAVRKILDSKDTTERAKLVDDIGREAGVLLRHAEQAYLARGASS